MANTSCKNYHQIDGIYDPRGLDLCFRQIMSGVDYGLSLGNKDLEHLGNYFAAVGYIRIARTIAARMKQGSRILDWGCGYGQVSLLLKELGLNVESFEVEPRPNIDKIPPFSQLAITYGEPGDPLPYESGSFDAVLSCGTLEHVPYPPESLLELRRVVRKGGKLFIFMLPNALSYTEKLASWRGTSCHPIKFTVSSTRNMLKDAGFRMTRISRAHALPHNWSGFPMWFSRAYGSFAPVLTPLDRFLSVTPVLNSFCGVFEVTAEKL